MKYTINYWMISMEFVQKMNPDDFCDSQTFPLQRAGQSLRISHLIYTDQA